MVNIRAHQIMCVVFIIAVIPRNTRLFQVYSLIIDPKEGSYYDTGQQRFWPMRKNFSDVFLDAEFEYVSRISLSPTPFALHQTM